MLWNYPSAKTIGSNTVGPCITFAKPAEPNIGRPFLLERVLIAGVSILRDDLDAAMGLGRRALCCVVLCYVVGCSFYMPVKHLRSAVGNSRPQKQ